MSYLKSMKLEHPERMPVKFWCAKCDGRLIDPKDPTTGTFYEVFGHVRKYPSKDTINYGGEENVIFALCPNCDD